MWWQRLGGKFVVERSIRGHSPLCINYESNDINAILNDARSIRGDAVFDVSYITGNTDYGNMLLFFNSDEYAWIRLLEHCEHLVVDPIRQQLSGDVTFFDGVDGNFEIDQSETVTRQTALSMLDCWLRTGKKLDYLHWG